MVIIRQISYAENSKICFIRREFISLINRSFPTGHKLRKIFNRNTLKLGYSSMPNVKQLKNGHNKAILQSTETAQLQEDEGKQTCNCRKKEKCPLDGECLVSKSMYQATYHVSRNIHRPNSKPV